MTSAWKAEVSPLHNARSLRISTIWSSQERQTDFRLSYTYYVL